MRKYWGKSHYCWNNYRQANIKTIEYKDKGKFKAMNKLNGMKYVEYMLYEKIS